jgi:hypothetical protein
MGDNTNDMCTYIKTISNQCNTVKPDIVIAIVLGEFVRGPSIHHGWIFILMICSTGDNFFFKFHPWLAFKNFYE